jgi:small-conductance mechanosensitive channel
VTTISLRSTTIITNDNISIIVPNSSFITESVINWSHSGTRVQLRLPISAAYGSDTEKVRTVLEDVAAAHPHVLKDPPPHVYFLGFGESSLNFELGVWTSEMMHQPRRFRSQLNFAIERAFRDNRIEIPFPQRDLHVRSAPWLPPTSAAGHSPNDSSDAGGRASAV